MLPKYASRYVQTACMAATVSVCSLAAIPGYADAPGRGKTSEFEKSYLTFIINHHFSALRMSELAAGTDLQRDAAVNNPEEGTAPTPNTSQTPAKASSEDIKSMSRMANRMQREEIIKAQRFLRDWYGVNHTPQLTQQGQQQIQTLTQTAAGNQFDRAFLETFSNHHYGALIPSQDCRVKADLLHNELKHYCEGIVENQTREINGMRDQLCKRFNVCDFQPSSGSNGSNGSGSPQSYNRFQGGAVSRLG
jgi:uncharacterized protein (DUF305 family)